jgi:hypothetical protein
MLGLVRLYYVRLGLDNNANIGQYRKARLGYMIIKRLFWMKGDLKTEMLED